MKEKGGDGRGRTIPGQVTELGDRNGEMRALRERHTVLVSSIKYRN